MLEYFNPRTAYESLQAFLAQGGPVLVAIMVLSFIMWGFILERIMFWTTAADGVIRRTKRSWEAWPDHTSWYGHAYRERLLSEAKQEASRFNSVIKILVAVTPLLGLLGTVTGMVFVFDIMAITGSSNARLMASGISRATIPTMAGLFTSVSGVMFTYWFDQFVQRHQAKLHDELDKGDL
ncbi:MAG: MotA/TolQ/ExbB proton channel family protein [Alphaproteobacteria bacterium]|nr:MotA/TolQ/ExbB proton channel family protein [Alphaproteobacteria bacterium]